jgi:hypothetical protein
VLRDSWVAERQAVSQGGLTSMDTDNYKASVDKALNYSSSLAFLRARLRRFVEIVVL